MAGVFITKIPCQPFPLFMTIFEYCCYLSLLFYYYFLQVEFAEHVFPYLVHNVLECDDDVARTTLSDQFRNFFSHCNGTSVITSSASSPFATAVPSSNTSGIFGSEWNECQIRLRERSNSKGKVGGGGGEAGHIYFSETGHLTAFSKNQKCSVFIKDYY